jgi:HK97 family phage major capsid protein
MTLTMAQKTDIALSALTADGGYLAPEHSGKFFQKVIDQPTILREARGIQMTAPEMKIPKIGFSSRILRKASQTGGATDTGSNGRHVLAADRVAPQFGQVTMKTEELIAEIHISDEVLEDNIEGAGLTNTIMSLIGERVALDLEELLLQGDTALAGTDPYLGAQDGVLKLATSNIVDAAGALVSPDLWNSTKKSMPKRFRRNLNTMRLYTGMDRESDYRLAVSSRGSDLGDAILTGTAPLPVFGIPMKGVALMPETNALMLNPQNLLWGIQRNIRIERDRDIRARTWIIVLTLRAAIAIEEADAVVKVTNIG